MEAVTSDYLFNLSEEELYHYIKYTLKLNVLKEDIKQIECDYNNNVYLLLNNGTVYQNGNVILTNIDYLWACDIYSIYAISADNIIKCLSNQGDATTYMNNNNEPYQKIIVTDVCLVGLTKDKLVKFIGGYYPSYSIDAYRFINVDDILVKGNELKVVYVIKDGKELPLLLEDKVID